jgi:hypothetical protein
LISLRSTGGSGAFQAAVVQHAGAGALSSAL